MSGKALLASSNLGRIYMAVLLSMLSSLSLCFGLFSFFLGLFCSLFLPNLISLVSLLTTAGGMRKRKREGS